jgi:hypothetical protein
LKLSREPEFYSRGWSFIIMNGKIVENYCLLDVLGAGQYGKVYKALHFKTNQIFACKVVKIEKFKEVPKLE